MCGRYSLFAPPEDLETRFGATVAEDYEPRYNAAPGQALPVVTNDAPDALRRLRWGLVPSWADERRAHEHVNARAETAAERPSFREAYRQRRCLVPADGFYEWADGDAGRQPYRVTLADGGPFAMAGLWERWQPPTAQAGLDAFAGDGPADSPPVVETFTILTTEPNDVVAPLHDRMAVVLPPSAEQRWLHGDPETVADLLEPYPADEMRAYPVSTAVNDPANDSPAVIEEVEPA